MTKKPEIQYLGQGQYYVYGSEAKKAVTLPKIQLPKLPQIPKEAFQQIYIDPVALAGIVVAAFMLVVMIIGAYQLKDTRAQYDRMSTYLTQVKREHASLSHTYHTSYDLETIRKKAEKIGMIDAEEAERFTVFVSVPEPRKEETVWDEVIWLLSGLFANAKHS